MSKTWSEHSEEEQLLAYAKIKAIYDYAGNPEWLEDPEAGGSIVLNLASGVTREYPASLVISGRAPIYQKALVNEITEKINEALSEVSDLDIAISCSVAVGDKMADIVDASKVTEEGKTTVKHEQGQVILYDFWATWCEPCQQPMAHNQHMLETRGADWGDKVRIVGLSLDDADDMDELKNYVEEKKWLKIEHYNVKNGVCTAGKDHGIKGIPFVFLVDTHGKIVFKGHPSKCKLEEDIDSLLKGETITVQGTQPAAAQEEEGGASISNAKAKSLYQQQIKDLLASHKEQLSGLSRAQTVMEFTSRFNVKTGVIIYKSNVDARIAASAEAVEAIRDVVEAALSGPWVTKVDFKIIEIQTKCAAGHRLKRYDAPIGERGATYGLKCDVCGGGIAKCEDGYYNCGQEDCNWDACTKCAKEEPA